MLKNSLKNSWTLIDEIKSLNITTDLRSAIDSYIANYERTNIRGDKLISRFCCVMFRCNLHYIIDNINKPTLTQELIAYNLKEYNR